MRPEAPPPPIDAGPTAVQDWFASALVGSWVKRRNEPLNWSATDSPRPEPGTDSLRVSDQLTRVPLRLDELLVIRSVHPPLESTWFTKVLAKGCWGLKGPAPMPMPPAWVGACAIGITA